MKRGKFFYIDGSKQFNHGCADWAVYRANGNGTATCTEASSCNSDAQLGHGDDHVFAAVGDILPMAELKARVKAYS